MSITCPFCGNQNVQQLKNIQPNQTYALSIIDTDKGPTLPSQYLPVDVYGCLQCKAIFLVCESLREKK
ncbi:hypothetical protein D2962_09630 [Biomaibacter acetigenes]|uniref:Uncharacterized protein n=1 Tax=Biomaibacter acetigenes TaxID=2316383 RepID=A0A3G2R5V2_9FIRM|nr:hypothetical protein D2962_09630 [Biomaibacter acetigenes]